MQSWDEGTANPCECTFHRGINNEYYSVVLKHGVAIVAASAIDTTYYDGRWPKLLYEAHFRKAKARKASTSRVAAGTRPASVARCAVHTWDSATWLRVITALEDTTVREILLPTSQTSAHAQQAILKEVEAKKVSDQVRENSFAHAFNEVARIYKRAIEAIKAIIESIQEQISLELTFDSKRNALLAQCDVAEQCIHGPGSDLGSSVRESSQYRNDFGTALTHVLEPMSDEEIGLIRDDARLVDRVVEVKDFADSYCMEMGVDSVLRELEADDEAEHDEDEGAEAEDDESVDYCKYIIPS
ncbi:hypothetical protein LTR78_005924 [Recurvomyces mirabilis]|uniref:Uncharacterized protein n=1 Tax=Recurvomyces mirabilis TaxID=574656 RepID=A0AAE1C0J8_9PEZI|nr:hypothetical protein LTR78_005924 [Recurvomyces mirabilis]